MDNIGENMEAGDYVRTKNGLIFKVDEEKKNIDINEFLNIGGNRDITKHSKNIIDLIEVGDYVNGHKVISTKSKIKNTLEVEAQAFRGNYFIDYDDIKTILTHEMYEQNCYKLKE